ncbi:MAG: hypothetical protein AAF704_13410 [Cyanobacteria bacterium P01_D01_bin.123]
MDEATEVVVDKGYRGIAKLHTNSQVPLKRFYQRLLSDLECEYTVP